MDALFLSYPQPSPRALLQLNGFVDRFEGAAEQGAGGAYVPRGSALEPVVAFLTALQSDDTNGRIVVNTNQGACPPSSSRSGGAV